MTRLPLPWFLVILAAAAATPAQAQLLGPRTEASACAAAIGGNVTDSKVSVVCGIPPEQLDQLVNSRAQALTARNEKIIALLEQNLDLNQRQIRAALEIVGEATVPPEQLAARLVEIARRFAGLRDATVGQSGDSAAMAALRADTSRAIDGGDLERADQLLAEIGKLQDADFDRRALARAQTSAQRGAVALTRLRYREAAEHFAAAASRVPAEQDDLRHRYLIREANSLWQHGAAFGDNDAANGAIDRFRLLLERRPREQAPLDWARSQFNIGVALTTLGSQERGTAQLEQAVVAYQAALQEFTRERAPDDWAWSQVSLGLALTTLGTREGGTARLEQAVAAYRAAAEVITRERDPAEWATLQSSLALALTALGARASGTAPLEDAAAAYRAALEAVAFEQAPQQWGAIQLGLADALRHLAVHETGNRRLAESVAAYRAALLGITRDRVPVQWFGTKNGLGVSLVRLAERSGDIAPLEEAVQTLREALSASGVAAAAHARETTARNLAYAERLLAERQAPKR